MKKFRSVLFFLAFAVLLTGILPSFAQGLSLDNTESIGLKRNMVPEYLDFNEAVQKGHVKRLYHLESELNHVIFENADGSQSLYLFGEDIKYVDEEGTVKDKSNQLKKVFGGFQNSANDVRVFFFDSIQDGVRLSYEKYSISMEPLDYGKGASSAAGYQWREDAINQKIVYENAYGSGTSVLYTQNFSGIKEEIRLRSGAGTNGLSFRITLKGLHPELKGDSLNFLDSVTGDLIGEMGEIVVRASSGAESRGSYSLEATALRDTYIVTMEASVLSNQEEDDSDLSITNSITIGNGWHSAISDTTIFSNYDESFGSRPTVAVGNYNLINASANRGVARALVAFPELMSDEMFLELHSGGHLRSVKYNFADAGTQSGTIIGAYLAISYWSESSTVYNETIWNSCGEYIGAVELQPYDYNGISSYARGEIDITIAVSRWLDQGVSDYGIMLKAEDETLKAALLGASEAGTSAGGRADSKPYVVVHYEPSRNQLIYKIRNVDSEQLLTVSNALDANEVNVYTAAEPVEPQSGSDGELVNYRLSLLSQNFRLAYDSAESAYRIHALCSKNGRHRVLDVVKSATGIAGLTPGCNVEIYNPTDNIAQLFLIEEVVDGFYKIVLKNNPVIALTANTGTGALGNVYMDTYTESFNQLWTFERSEKNDEELYYSLMNLSYPFSGENAPLRITSGFGMRNISGSISDHNGIDISANSGTSVYCLFDGTVTKVAYDNSRGYHVIVESADPRHRVYGSDEKLRFVVMHLRESATATNSQVVVGASLTAGTQIGKVGSTGDSTGAHLHLGIIFDETNDTQTVHTIDPMMFFPEVLFTFNNNVSID